MPSRHSRIDGPFEKRWRRWRLIRCGFHRRSKSSAHVEHRRDDTRGQPPSCVGAHAKSSTAPVRAAWRLPAGLAGTSQFGDLDAFVLRQVARTDRSNLETVQGATNPTNTVAVHLVRAPSSSLRTATHPLRGVRRPHSTHEPVLPRNAGAWPTADDAPAPSSPARSQHNLQNPEKCCDRRYNPPRLFGHTFRPSSTLVHRIRAPHCEPAPKMATQLCSRLACRCTSPSSTTGSSDSSPSEARRAHERIGCSANPRVCRRSGWVPGSAHMSGCAVSYQDRDCDRSDAHEYDRQVRGLSRFHNDVGVVDDPINHRTPVPTHVATGPAHPLRHDRCRHRRILTQQHPHRQLHLGQRQRRRHHRRPLIMRRRLQRQRVWPRHFATAPGHFATAPAARQLQTSTASPTATADESAILHSDLSPVGRELSFRPELTTLSALMCGM